MMTRRSFFLGAAGPAALPIEVGPRPLKVVCVGAHPDDPESGCGGTLARYTAAGHEVAIIYLTRGERGLPGKPLEEAAALLTFRSYRASRPGAMLYFHEVESGFQSLGFQPTSYVDITSTREKKKAALFIHESHGVEIEIYRKHHEMMENFRGREAGVAAAEAFVPLARDGGMDRLPGA